MNREVNGPNFGCECSSSDVKHTLQEVPKLGSTLLQQKRCAVLDNNHRAIPPYVEAADGSPETIA